MRLQWLLRKGVITKLRPHRPRPTGTKIEPERRLKSQPIFRLSQLESRQLVSAHQQADVRNPAYHIKRISHAQRRMARDQHRLTCHYGMGRGSHLEQRIIRIRKSISGMQSAPQPTSQLIVPRQRREARVQTRMPLTFERLRTRGSRQQNCYQP